MGRGSWHPRADEHPITRHDEEVAADAGLAAGAAVRRRARGRQAGERSGGACCIRGRAGGRSVGERAAVGRIRGQRAHGQRAPGAACDGPTLRAAWVSAGFGGGLVRQAWMSPSTAWRPGGSAICLDRPRHRFSV